MFMRWRTNTLTSSQLSSLTRTKVFAAWKMCEGTRTIHIISEKNERCVASNILITALLHAKRKIQLSLIFKCHFIWLWYISIRIYFDIWWFNAYFSRNFIRFIIVELWIQSYTFSKWVWIFKYIQVQVEKEIFFYESIIERRIIFYLHGWECYGQNGI